MQAVTLFTSGIFRTSFQLLLQIRDSRVWTPPSIGATVKSIRGVIIDSAYADGNGGLYPYVIVPIYPNDLTMGNTPPFISSVARFPGVPTPSNTVQVNAVVSDTLDNTLSVDSCQLFYRVNSGSYTKLNMTPSGNIFSCNVMPSQTLGTLVEYFIRARDNQGSIKA